LGEARKEAVATKTAVQAVLVTFEQAGVDAIRASDQADAELAASLAKIGAREALRRESLAAQLAQNKDKLEALGLSEMLALAAERRATMQRAEDGRAAEASAAEAALSQVEAKQAQDDDDFRLGMKGIEHELKGAVANADKKQKSTEEKAAKEKKDAEKAVASARKVARKSSLRASKADRRLVQSMSGMFSRSIDLGDDSFATCSSPPVTPERGPIAVRKGQDERRRSFLNPGSSSSLESPTGQPLGTPVDDSLVKSLGSRPE
jgi:hypothetical protein